MQCASLAAKYDLNGESTSASSSAIVSSGCQHRRLTAYTIIPYSWLPYRFITISQSFYNNICRSLPVYISTPNLDPAYHHTHTDASTHRVTHTPPTNLLPGLSTQTSRSRRRKQYCVRQILTLAFDIQYTSNLIRGIYLLYSMHDMRGCVCMCVRADKPHVDARRGGEWVVNLRHCRCQ